MLPLRKRTNVNQLREFEQGRIIGLLVVRVSFHDIGNRIGRNVSNV